MIKFNVLLLHFFGMFGFLTVCSFAGIFSIFAFTSFVAWDIELLIHAFTSYVLMRISITMSFIISVWYVLDKNGALSEWYNVKE